MPSSEFRQFTKALRLSADNGVSSKIIRQRERMVAMFKKESHDIEFKMATCPVHALKAESRTKSAREEDEARERMVAARREQQRLSIIRRLTMSGMLCLS